MSGRHSVIDKPLPVSRVMPPITTIMATSSAMIKSQATTAPLLCADIVLWVEDANMSEPWFDVGLDCEPRT